MDAVKAVARTGRKRHQQRKSAKRELKQSCNGAAKSLENPIMSRLGLSAIFVEIWSICTLFACIYLHDFAVKEIIPHYKDDWKGFVCSVFRRDPKMAMFSADL